MATLENRCYGNMVFKMGVKISIILILFASLQLNSQIDTLIYNINVEEPQKAAFCLKNNSDSLISFKLKFNNKFFYNDSEIASYIKSGYNKYPNEPLHQKTWRFVIDNIIHQPPLSFEQWQHNPFIFLNSIGFGICDDINTNLAILWKMCGYESRVWDLNSHVVAEVKINDRWECYDANFGAYHINPNNTIANIGELENNIELFSDSQTFDYPKHNYANLMINTKRYISHYQTKNNYANEWYNSYPDFYPNNFNLPPDSYLEFPGVYNDSIKTQFNIQKNTTSNARLVILKSWTGKVYQPLQLANIKGKGIIKIDNISFELGAKELSNFLRKNDRIITSFEIIESNSEIIAIYFVNPIVFKVLNNNKLMLAGNDIELIKCNEISLNESEYISYREIDFIKIKDIAKKLDEIEDENDFDKKMKNFFIIENTDNNTKIKTNNNIKNTISKINKEKLNVFYKQMRTNVVFVLFMYEVNKKNSNIINEMIAYFNR